MKVPSALVALSAFSVKTSAFRPAFAGLKTNAKSSSALTMSVQDDIKTLAVGALTILAGVSILNAPVEAITKDQIESLSYLQVKGTGLANRCPEVFGTGSIDVNGKTKIVDMCIEPKTFQVLEETSSKRGEAKKEYVNTKLMTRQTYTLYGIDGSFAPENGKITFREKDGIDYAATTIQLPGGERVPFLFTVKELVAQATTPGNSVTPGLQFGGPFSTPSYRTGLFLDPKGRGGSTGYDMAVALPGKQSGIEGDAELFGENNKTFDVTKGNIEFEVNRVDPSNGEIGGVFVSKQKGDTDMGSKVPKDLLIKGIFYGRLESE
uniref:Photosystem II extrinsic protein O n=2 Tax=Eukaryota TaxID=2759 RepID=B7SSL7_ELYCH|nr:photosystem II extrinsic protein O [Vaucheria litorea]ACF22979.1 chloroplast photosystem II extrinsic protein O [Vaucheria litorea]ACF22980.1 photosystem II extrinsic protein O [Elysia chlorotica]|eukprot:CAMPEP_0171460764 /NCGR_PEP_ID=MMETSP0945-20130129/5504_1 /TAXON_ID=109269 /ORGANISM="Vaucheria litorea, Strain CCMP2940" /LENGTH=320 /DNA_ID=CAMNT_0011987021 /DNA_START=62 /DNA_END=1024 /DNA_ORIENTATION=-